MSVLGVNMAWSGEGRCWFLLRNISLALYCIVLYDNGNDNNIDSDYAVDTTMTMTLFIQNCCCCAFHVTFDMIRVAKSLYFTSRIF